MKTPLLSRLWVLGSLILSGFPAWADIDERFTEVKTEGDPPKILADFRFDRLETAERAEGWAGGEKIADGNLIPSAEIPGYKEAYAFVIDVSDPRRAATIRKCAETAAALIASLDPGAAVAVFSLGSTVEAVAPFGSDRAEIQQALDRLRPGGDQSGSTLIYGGCEKTIRDHLAKVEAARKALVIFSDGDDETGKGKPDEGQLQLKAANDLVETANEAKVTIFSLGYAERPEDLQKLKTIGDVADKTRGLHVHADTGTKEIPAEFRENFPRYLGAGGRAEFDAGPFAGKQGFVVKLFTAEGGEHQIPKEAMNDLVAPAPDTPGPADGADPAAEEEETAAEPAPPGKPDLFTWGLAGGAVLLLLLILALALRARAKTRAEAARREAELKSIDEQMQHHPVLGTGDEEDAVAGGKPGPALAWLVMLDADQTRVAVRSRSVRVGRGKEDEIRIANNSVSRGHCNLKLDPDGNWLIHDLDSGNGVFLNGKQVEQSVLKEGDVVELGEVRMRFTLTA